MNRPPFLVERLRPFGTTIFSEMTELAVANDAVNLGQGFPDQDPHPAIVSAACEALRAGHHQYAPGPGVAPLRQAVGEHQARCYGLEYDPDTEVTVTFGATEALTAAILALCDEGDEVLVLEPTYDSYSAVIAMARAREVRVALDPPSFEPGRPVEGGFRLDLERLERAVTPRSKVLILNTPHNPTGMVLEPPALDAIASLCVRHDLIAVCDEVYEHLVFDGEHVPLATRPGMRERTIVISSAGKTFSCTGWKIGWACAPPSLTEAVRATKQFLSFAGGTPLQHAVARALSLTSEIVPELVSTHRRRRDMLVHGLEELGIPALRPAGTYFVTADVSTLRHPDAMAFCRRAPAEIGVAAVPVAAFVREPANVASLVRFAICKREDVLAEALRRLGGRPRHGV